jgi:anti-sigma B factor antagonist
MRLECAVHRRDDGVMLVPSGDLDLDVLPDLRRLLDNAVAAGVARIDVDLRLVTFLDSSGLGAFVAAHRAAAARGAVLRLHEPSPLVRTVLEMTNLHDLLVDDAGPSA